MRQGYQTKKPHARETMPVSSLLACFLTYVKLWTMAAENILVIQWGRPTDLGRAGLGWQHLLRTFKEWLFSSAQHLYTNSSVVLWFFKPPDWESKHLHVKPRIYDKNTALCTKSQVCGWSPAAFTSQQSKQSMCKSTHARMSVSLLLCFGTAFWSLYWLELSNYQQWLIAGENI